jgi:hypothetical protein
MVSVDILKSDLWRNHVLTVLVRMLVRGQAGPDHPCFPTSQYSFRDDCVVLGCTRPIQNEYLTIWKMQIIFIFFSLTATAQDVQVTKLELWMAINDGTDVLQP